MARRIEQIQRNRKNRKTKESILFEFEGKNKTEEIYFRNFQKRDNPYNLKFAYGNDTDPVSMVKSLISYMKKEEINTANNDKIYCVFDADIDISKQKRIDEAIRLASENGIEMIISIPCFELWYRLHYSYTSKVIVSNNSSIKASICSVSSFILETAKFLILALSISNASFISLIVFSTPR